MNGAVPDIQTIPELVKWFVSQSPDSPAWFSKHDNHWHGVTRREYHQQIEALSQGLCQMGVREGDRAILMFPNGLEWELLEKALYFVGAIVVGVDASTPTEQKKFIICDSGSTVLFAETPEAVGALPQETLQKLEHIIVLRGNLGTHAALPAYITFLELLDLGKLVQQPRSYHVMGDQLATITYTSGTNGLARGVPYTHNQCLIACRSILYVFPSFSPQDVTVCLLPLSHLYQRIINLCAIASGAKVYFISSPSQFRQDLQAIQPTILVCVPRLFEKLQEQVEAKLAALPCGLGRILRFLITYQVLPPRILRSLILGKRIRILITGAASIPPATLGFFWETLKIPLLEAYGLSENAVPMAMNTLAAQRDGSVGHVLKENTLRIAEDGEIEVKGAGVFTGYWNDAKKEYFTPDGFYRTGDLGMIDEDGFLYLTGRKSDMIKTSTGRRIAPGRIEAQLIAIAGVEAALVYGDDRKHLVALLQGPSLEADAALLAALAAVNRKVAPYEQIGGALVTQKAFSIQAGHLTTSLKLRKKVIEDMYKTEIETLYARIHDPYKIQLMLF